MLLINGSSSAKWQQQRHFTLTLTHTHPAVARTHTVLPLVFYGYARQLGMPSSNVALTGLPSGCGCLPVALRFKCVQL